MYRGSRLKPSKKVNRLGKWCPPPEGTLKINIDGSTQGNLRDVGIGGVGCDSSGAI